MQTAAAAALEGGYVERLVEERSGEERGERGGGSWNGD